MKITTKNNIRCFTRGETFEFEFKQERTEKTNNRFLFILGDNGCGKSTIMKAIRSKVTTYGHSYAYEKSTESNVNLKFEIDDISKYFDIDGVESYNVIAALDGISDNPENWGNCVDAASYVDNGGYATKNLSGGMRSISTYIEWMKTITNEIEYGKTLILLDEIDCGWKVEYTTNFIDILNKHFNGCDFIIVTHNPICWYRSSDNITHYDLQAKYIVDHKIYFNQKTGWYMDISPYDKDALNEMFMKKYEEKITELTNENKLLKKQLELNKRHE